MSTVKEAPVEVRDRLSEFIRDVYETHTEVDTTNLCRMAKRRFSKDAEFTDALVREALALLVPALAIQVRSHMRLEGHGEATLDRLASVFAHVGDSRHKALLTMTRPEHLFAADERRTKARTSLLWADFHESIAALLPNDECQTGECLTEDQLTDLYEKHFD